LIKPKYIIALLLAVLCRYASATEPDTVNAVVMYGEDFLLEKYTHKSTEELKDLRDSLLAAPNRPYQFIRNLTLYLKIPDMTFDEVFTTIDSLFECDEIPYPLINQINWYVAHNELKDKPIEEVFDTLPFPAHLAYHDWNTSVPNPSSYKKLSSSLQDTILSLIDGRRSTAFVLPHEGKLTSGFGPRDGRNHNGIDLDLEVWDPVKTAVSYTHLTLPTICSV